MALSVEQRMAALKQSQKKEMAQLNFAQARERMAQMPTLTEMMNRISLNMKGIVYGPADDAVIPAGLPLQLHKPETLIS